MLTPPGDHSQYPFHSFDAGFSFAMTSARPVLIGNSVKREKYYPRIKGIHLIQLDTKVSEEALARYNALTVRENNQEDDGAQRPAKPEYENNQRDNDIHDRGCHIKLNKLDKKQQCGLQCKWYEFARGERTSKMWLIACPRSRIRRISPVFRRVWKARERLNK